VTPNPKDPLVFAVILRPGHTEPASARIVAGPKNLLTLAGGLGAVATRMPFALIHPLFTRIWYEAPLFSGSMSSDFQDGSEWILILQRTAKSLTRS
jgi:hypothetical protein